MSPKLLHWLLYNTQPFHKEVKMYSSLQSNIINVSITCVHMWNSHVGRFKNTVFSLQTSSGYVVNLQHICFSVNRQPCGFIQVRHTNARGCLFSIGLIFWLLHASAGLGLFPTALLRHTQFLLVSERACERGSAKFVCTVTGGGDNGSSANSKVEHRQ